MPRDANGNYSLPSGNPVVSNTMIESVWANATMADIRQALTESLDRNGRGGMLVPFKFVNGTHATPAITFTSEASTGLYLAGTKDVRMAISGLADDVMKWTDTGIQFWKGATWVNLVGDTDNTFSGAQTATKFQVKDAGASLYWEDSAFVSGLVKAGTAEPTASTEQGRIYLQYPP